MNNRPNTKEKKKKVRSEFNKQLDYSNNSNYKIDKNNQIKSWAFERFLNVLTSIKSLSRGLIYETETDSHREQIVVAKEEEEWERDGLGFGDQQMKAIVYKMDKQQVQLYST